MREMALSERQEKAVLKLFVNTFASADADKRKDVYMDFVDSFLGGIKQWDVAIHDTFIDEGIPTDIINQWQKLEEVRKENCVEEDCEICKMTMADELQIVKLISEELDLMPSYAEFDKIGTVKDFEDTGYSFVAKKNNEVVGVLMAQKIMDYGFGYIYVNNFAVESSMQGRGIGKRLLKHLIDVARQDGFHMIKLHTKRKLKAYDWYHHMGFQDQESESVYLTKWFI
jgi:ribosomal protein S18 acetylase RimI-like enzyme